ncbi:hypothetical protein JR316_0002571 [Psilocybe cubensis]|uniref:Uncharacterized protein n=2 Tax=Psilocybe cubensis TaxID=181762 RepID=A0ACB8HCK8_PSICU|nr:hypothetical protein JR316_0002571 [Psilocybe cubensis]KAH9485661.1 hypothetical protein JR316_0002571 [Psilocybe cubensis]
MADIVVEKRKSTPKIEFEDRKRIQFHVISVKGLPQSTGWQTMSSISVSVESLETRDSFATEQKKSGSLISWGENMPQLDLKDSSKVRFELKSQVLWKNKTVLGSTDTLTVGQLLKMQSEAGEDRDAHVDLLVSTKSSATNSPKQAVLSIIVRQTAMKDRNSVITAADQSRFVEMCSRQSSEELRAFVGKMVRFRKALEDTPKVFVRRIIENPVTKNINKNTVALSSSLNEAFTPFESLSARHMGKQSEHTMQMMGEMMCGVVKALVSVENFLRMQDVFAKDKLEFKVTYWIKYFEDCAKFLLEKDTKRPVPLINKTSRRIALQSPLVANGELPKHNMLPMEIPATYSSGSYDRPDLVRLVAEWIFSPSFRETGRPDSPNAGSRRSSSHSVHTSSGITANNVFCLSGAPGCGKTQLAAHIMDWLRDMGCLGGYFSFDLDSSSSAKRTPSQILDALPMTIIHQISVAEPDAEGHLKAAFTKAQASAAIHGNLEERFEKLFVGPMREFEKGRVAPLWNPLEPLVFVIDGVGSRTGVGECDSAEAKAEYQRMVEVLAGFLSSKAMSRVPQYIKFLVLCRPETGLARMLSQTGTGYVSEMGHIVQYVESSSFSSPPSPLPTPSPGSTTESGIYGPTFFNGNTSGPPSPNPKVSIQAF